MSVGSDNKKLSVSPAVVPGISVDPPTPELNAKSSSPQKKRFLPNCSKQITKDLVLRSRI